MEELVKRGLVRHIGTSNMTIPKLKLVLRDARIKPAVNEMELHPHFQQPELFDFVRANGIEPIGYSPLGSPHRPERDRTPEDTAPTEDPVILRIAAKPSGIHPAVVCIKWAVQRGQTPIPFSAIRRTYRPICMEWLSDPLSAEEMRAIAAHRPKLPPDQRPGLSVERWTDLGRPLGHERRNHAGVDRRSWNCDATQSNSREVDSMRSTMKAAYPARQQHC